MERTKIAEIKQGFGYKQVQLMDSHWKDQRDYVVELYLALPNDDILASPLRHAGVCECHGGLAGWGGTLGQFFGSYAKLYSVTGDFRLKAKCISLFEAWAEEADRHPALLHGGTYGYEKMLGGLLDMYEFMGYDRAEKYISILTDQSIEDLDPDIDRDGLQDARMKHQIEWYTLPENLYRAYQLFGDEKYKSYAEIWHYDYMWDKILNRDFKIGPRHAYSHVNCMSSAARAYEVTGDKKYLDIMTIAYDELLAHHIYATGGYGPGENLFMDKEGYLGFMISSPWDLGGEDPGFINFAGSRVARSDAWGSCEVSCCAWAVFKYCNYLMKHTGDAKYGVWVEKLLYNGVGGQPNIRPNGDLLYYSDYFVDGGMKSVTDRRLQRHGENFRWQCCSGTFPQDTAEYANMIYYHDRDALYVSQYLPSRVECEIGGNTVELTNFSRSPVQETLSFRISAQKGGKFPIKFRVPDWADGKNRVTVNGQTVDIPCNPNTWMELNREWGSDDLVEISYPFRLRFKAVDEKHGDIVALCCGPIVLVSTEMTLLVGDKEHPESWILPVEGQEFTFKTEPGHTGAYPFVCRTFVPYYTYPEDKWYFMYNRIFRDTNELMGLESKPMGQE